MIKIGVTGHRFLAELGKLQAGINQALAHIDQHFPGQDWSVISSLAEGADRLVLERVLGYRPTARLIVPLPIPVVEYLADFSSTASRQEFERYLDRADEIIPMPAAGSREEAYRAAGVYVIQQSSLLIALWDGQGAQGKGGTGEIVEIARRRGLPLAWVMASNQHGEPYASPAKEETQGTVVYERF